MDEHDWLTSSDPQAMLSWHGNLDAEGTDSTGAAYTIKKISDRKLRLFACACVRQVWGRLADNDRKGIVLAEMDPWGQLAVGGVAHAAYCGPQALANYTSTLDDDRCIRYAVGWLNASVASEVASQVPGWLQRIVDAKIQASILRDIVGNPYRPVQSPYERIPSRWPNSYYELREGWLTPTVLSVAQAAYDERTETGTLDPVRLAVLADALEEVGCADDLLAHLREPGPHYRGCWVVDLLLGKE